MVLLHIKKGDDSQFLYETSVKASLAEVVPQVAVLFNERKRLERLIAATKDLLEYGPLKQDNQQGYTEEQIEELSNDALPPKPVQTIQRDGFSFDIVTDPTGRRVGECAGPEAKQIVTDALTRADAFISNDKVKAGKTLTLEGINDCITNVKASMTIVYPGGLPEWETVREILDGNEDLAGSAASKDVLIPDQSSLWWAGKELKFEKTLSDFIGKNDKTKIIAKIQKKGASAPMREAPISEAEQKNMMAYYYRKQEAQKKLEENKDDDYLNSSWADNNSLKKSFTGMNDVKWRAY